jgi:hypothetical protein
MTPESYFADVARHTGRALEGSVYPRWLRRYAGKGQSELGLLRTLLDLFRPGDIVLPDRQMSAWTEMVLLKQRGIDCVCASRKPLTTALSRTEGSAGPSRMTAG